MNARFKFVSALALGFALCGCASQGSHEREEGDEKQESSMEESGGADKLAKVPAAAQESIKQIVGKHEIGDVDSETENGKMTYEVDYKVKKTEFSVTVSDTGEVLEREVEVEKTAVPPAVIDVANKAHADGKIGEIDITEADGKLFYELGVKASDKKYEMRINADGSVMADAIDND